MLRFAFDKSARTTDADGRLHVALCNISKATVNPYRGDEIPDSAALGLDPTKVYQLLRDPEELAKGAKTFNALPLLLTHTPVSAANPEKDLVIGALGTDTVFEAPYLKASLVVWDAQAIAAIESGQQAQLSCGYRYVADMTPGTFEGVAYDGVMRDIVGNHVALVEVGRAGPDVVVADANPFKETDMKKVSGKTIAVRAALRAVVGPKLAADQALDWKALVGRVTAQTLAADTARILAGLKKAKIAHDEEAVKAAIESAKDESEEEAHKDDVEGGERANRTLNKEDPHREGEDDVGGGYVLDRILKILEGKVPADLLEQIKAAAKAPAQDEPAEEAHKDDVQGGRKANEILERERKDAMDKAIKLAEDRTVARLNGIAEAKEAVYPIVGKLGAMDSAEAVYKFALDHLSVDTTDVHPSAYKALVAAHTPKPKMAADSGPSDFWDQFPGARLPVRS